MSTGARRISVYRKLQPTEKTTQGDCFPDKKNWDNSEFLSDVLHSQQNLLSTYYAPPSVEHNYTMIRNGFVMFTKNPRLPSSSAGTW